MAAALTEAATNAAAAGDDLGAAMLGGAAGLVAGGLTVTSVTGVTFSRDQGAAVILGPGHLAGSGWAFGLELGIVQSTQPLEVGAYEGALVISGTDIAYAVPLTAIAAAGHWWLGSIDWMLLATLLVGSVPGITLGSWFARSMPERLLRGVLATVLVTVAAKLVVAYRGLRKRAEPPKLNALPM